MDITPAQRSKYRQAWEKLDAARKAGDVRAYSAAYLDFQAIATEIVNSQGMFEFSDAADARRMYSRFLAEPDHIVGKALEFSDEQVQAMTRLSATATKAFTGQTTGLQVAYAGLWTAEKAGTVASFALPGGPAKTLVEKGLTAALSQTAKGLLVGGATATGIELAGQGAVALGADAEVVGDIQHYGSAGLQLFNLAKAGSRSTGSPNGRKPSEAKSTGGASGVTGHQKTLDAAVRENLSGVKLTQPPTYVSHLANPQGKPLYGLARYGKSTDIGPKAFGTRHELLDTIIHEELHHRLWGRGITTAHDHNYINRVVARFLRMKGF